MALFDPKAKTIAALQKVIDEKKSEINLKFDEIGRLYYKQYRDDSVDMSKDINARCVSITSLIRSIEENKRKILFEKGLKVCETCKKENPLEHTFCSSCGAKFPTGSDTAVSMPDEDLVPVKEECVSKNPDEPVLEEASSTSSATKETVEAETGAEAVKEAASKTQTINARDAQVSENSKDISTNTDTAHE